jgi:DNA polymerase-3 subunit gamma/tau
MAYLVLARKWRPQNFADLVGQEHVSRTLANAIRTGRIHHAFLFTGARGVGKTSAARILAKALNCEVGLSDTPCGTCTSCIEIAAGQGLDVIEIDGASNTGVDDVRELRDNIRYLPSRSRYKIFIIDEVHMLSTSAFNALLKTLEEPPPHAKFIFATTEPHKIPVTILSRCQRFDFRKIALGRVAIKLREIADAEQLTISDRSLALIARHGEGSMRDALSTLDQVIAFCGDRVGDEDVQALLGMVDRRLLFDAVAAILQRDPRRALDATQRFDQLGVALRQVGQELIEVFRALVVCKVVPEPAEMIDMVGDELQEMQTLAAIASLEDLQRIVTLLLKLQVELAGSPYPLLTLEMAMVRLASLPPLEDLSKLLGRFEQLERRLATGAPLAAPAAAAARPGPPLAAPPPTTERPPKKADPPAVLRPRARGWEGLVEEVKQNRPMAGSVLEHGRPLRLEPPTLEVGYPEGSFHLAHFQDAANRQAVEAIARLYFDHPVTLRVVALQTEQQDLPPSLVEARQAEESDRQRRLRENALNHPALKAVQDIFGGEVKTVIPIDKGFV